LFRIPVFSTSKILTLLVRIPVFSTGKILRLFIGENSSLLYREYPETLIGQDFSLLYR
jgi:hypothetical protein